MTMDILAREQLSRDDLTAFKEENREKYIKRDSLSGQGFSIYHELSNEIYSH